MMNAKLKVFHSSPEWLSKNLTSAEINRYQRIDTNDASSISAGSLTYESNVTKQRLMEALDLNDQQTIQSLESENKRTQYKLFLCKGYVLGAKVTGEDVILYTPMGVSPDRLVDLNKEATSLISRMPESYTDISGRIIAHYTDMDVHETFKNDKLKAVKSKMIPSYMGRALYASNTLKLAFNARSSFRDSRSSEFNDSKGVAFFQVKPGANIVSSTNPDFQALKKDMDKKHFSILLKIKNIDGVYDEGLKSLAIHNPDAIEYVHSYKSVDLERLVERMEKMDRQRESLVM